MGATDIAVIDGLETNGAELRAALEALQAGVCAASHFKVTQRGAGANRSIDLAAGRAVLETPLNTIPYFLGKKYLVAQESLVNSEAFELGGIQAPHASFARLDQIILRLYDNEGGQRRWRPEVLKGTDPTQNATLDNRHNAAVLPAGVPVLRVADVVVPTSGIITNAEIRDRRQWAHGINRVITRTTNSGGTSDYATTSGSFVAVDSTNLTRRFECSGAPLVFQMFGRIDQTLAAAFGVTALYEDGVQLTEQAKRQHDATYPLNTGVILSHGYSPSPGSRVLEPRYRAGGGGTTTILAQAGVAVAIMVRELLGANGDNN